MKEFLDPSNNYEFIEWNGISCAPENWIEVPDGAIRLTIGIEQLIFWNDRGESVLAGSSSKFYLGDGYEKYCSNFEKTMKVLWQRGKESLNNKVASAEEFRKQLVADLPEFKHDVVNHPSHYNSGDIECIDAIQASMSAEAFAGFLKGNIIKYMWRYEHKNGIEDLKKSQWYQNKLIELLG